MELTISLASIADLPILAAINSQAYAPDIIMRFCLTRWPDEANSVLVFTSRVQERLLDPDTQVFKAVDRATGEITGCVSLTLKAAEEKPTFKPIAAGVEAGPDFLNMEFLAALDKTMNALEEPARGTRHYHVSTLAVAPKYQNRGIGLQLLRYCLAIADREGLPSWLTSVPGSHGFYLRLGFEDVMVRDTDLNEWDGFRYRGYGIYRSCSMKRIPRLDGDVMDGV